MEKYQKYGINPLLISIAIAQQLELVPSRPTHAMLPGKYPKVVFKHFQTVNSEFPENISRLTCKQCNKSADYDLGTLVLAVNAGEQPVMEKFQALGYFRCKHCNSAGEWELTARMRTMLAGKMAAAAARNAANQSASEVIFGEALIDNGFAPRWGSEAEEYFLQKLASTPDDAYLWNRLGNAYYRGKRPELAVVAHEQALLKDRGQVESLFSLGQILYDCNELEAAAAHLRQAIAFSHQYGQLSAYTLRELIVGALTTLLAIYNRSNNTIDMLPKPNELAMARFAKSEIAATAKLDFEIDTARKETLYPLAEVYLGTRRDELLPEERAVQAHTGKAAWPIAGKINKQKPPKKNKNKKRK